MKMLSDDDLNLKDMSDEELAAAWDLWFDLTQSTNDADPPYTHGVFVNLTWDDVAPLNDEPDKTSSVPVGSRNRAHRLESQTAVLGKAVTDGAGSRIHPRDRVFPS